MSCRWAAMTSPTASGISNQGALRITAYPLSPAAAVLTVGGAAAMSSICRKLPRLRRAKPAAAQALALPSSLAVPEGRQPGRQAASSSFLELAAAAFGDEPGEAVNAAPGGNHRP